MLNNKKLENEILDEKLLDQVSGGDRGDTKWETDHNTPLYGVGDTVYVYDSKLHVSTTEATVIRIYDYSIVHSDKTHWYYLVRYKNGNTEKVEADDIKRMH